MSADALQIELELELRPYTLAAPADPTDSSAVRAEAAVSGFRSSKPSSPSVAFRPVPPPPPATRAPVVAATVSTGGRAVLSPGSALGVTLSQPPVAALPLLASGRSTRAPSFQATVAGASSTPSTLSAPAAAVTRAPVLPVGTSASASAVVSLLSAPTPATMEAQATLSSVEPQEATASQLAAPTQATEFVADPSQAPSAQVVVIPPQRHILHPTPAKQATEPPPQPTIFHPTPIATARHAAASSAPLPASIPTPAPVPVPASASASAPPLAPVPVPVSAVQSVSAQAPVRTSSEPLPSTSARNGLYSPPEKATPDAPAAPVLERPSLPSAGASVLAPVPPRTTADSTPAPSSSSSRSSSKKRARPAESRPAPSAADPSPSSKNGRVTPRHRNTVPDDSESSDGAEPSSRRPSRRRRGSGRDGSSRRQRVSLTVNRLEAMGFTREDADASVAACGHDVDACMVWIVRHMEERQFQDDLNQASIQSELSKRAEEQEHKQQEQETMKKAKEFTAHFTTVRRPACGRLCALEWSVGGRVGVVLISHHDSLSSRTC